MTCLCDSDIQDAINKGLLEIMPRPIRDQLQPASIDLTLANDFLIPEWAQTVRIKPGERPNVKFAHKEGPILLRPGQFCLGRTLERVTIGGGIRARLEGKSTIGRCALLVHATAGYIDPGFTNSTITLELINLAPYPIELHAGAYIAQLAVELMTNKPQRLYGDPALNSHYQGQKATTGPQ
jgi:dCTP deaminase